MSELLGHQQWRIGPDLEPYNGPGDGLDSEKMIRIETPVETPEPRRLCAYCLHFATRLHLSGLHICGCLRCLKAADAHDPTRWERA